MGRALLRWFKCASMRCSYHQASDSDHTVYVTQVFNLLENESFVLNSFVKSIFKSFDRKAFSKSF